MSKMKHTPGPWKIRNGFYQETLEIYRPDKTVKPPFYPTEIATVSDIAGKKANARLIAASPELLIALQRFVEFTEQHGEVVFLGGGMPAIDAMNACTGLARAAIAKATGGST